MGSGVGEACVGEAEKDVWFHMVVDDGEDIIDVPITLVEPLTRNVDGSATFHLFGGPFHGQIVRIYNDKQMTYAQIMFDLHGKPCVYKMSPPAKNTRNK